MPLSKVLLAGNERFMRVSEVNLLCSSNLIISTLENRKLKLELSA